MSPLTWLRNWLAVRWYEKLEARLTKEKLRRQAADALAWEIYQKWQRAATIQIKKEFAKQLHIVNAMTVRDRK